MVNWIKCNSLCTFSFSHVLNQSTSTIPIQSFLLLQTISTNSFDVIPPPNFLMPFHPLTFSHLSVILSLPFTRCSSPTSLSLHFSRRSSPTSLLWPIAQHLSQVIRLSALSLCLCTSTSTSYKDRFYILFYYVILCGCCLFSTANGWPPRFVSGNGSPTSTCCRGGLTSTRPISLFCKAGLFF